MEFLTLKAGCTSSSESTLVKIPHCWESHVVAHIVSLVDTFNVDDPNILSDHCIVKFSLCLHGNNASSDSDPGITPSLSYKHVWNNEYVEAFQNALDSDSVRSDLRKLKNALLTGKCRYK